jgi:eukaryotic-like serine/threonine-protein kinase
MPLTPGTHLGPYEILAALGAGGMGEVYRARDSRLNRDVALKVLPAQTAADATAFARFEREAQAVAALSHPNILAVHDFGRTGTIAYVAFELLEGSTLRERLSDGPLPLRKAIDYARQVADGLAAAHARGITHRDIKPDNLFVTGEGRVKILDFGLARTSPLSGDAEDPGQTLTRGPLTGEGTVLGTIGYMAPEQVRGQSVDARADLFALGAVLFEMCTGQRAFRGPTAADTITAVLSSDPPELTLSGQPTPPALDRIVRRCLEKQPTERFQSARDLSFALDALSSLSGSGQNQAPGPVGPARRSWVPVAAAMVVALGAGLLSGRVLWPTVPMADTLAEGPLLRLEFEASTDTLPSLPIALSPDGRRLVFTEGVPGTGQRQLFVRDLGTGQNVVVPESIQGWSPAWSPQSDALVFSNRTELRRFRLGERTTSLVAPLDASFYGATWLADDSIVMAARGIGLRRVAAAGGAVTTVVSDPAVLFGGPVRIGTRTDYVLALRRPVGQGPRHIVAIRLADGHVTELVPNDAEAAYAGPGHLLLPRPNGLYAVAFDAQRLTVTGEPIFVTEPVVIDSTSGLSTVSASDAGVIAFRPERDALLQFEWVEPTGRSLGVVGPPAYYGSFALAPDGRRIVARVLSAPRVPTSAGLTVIDLARDVASPVATPAGSVSDPIWTADGARVLYRLGGRLMSQSPYGSDVSRLREEQVYPDHVSKDGRWLIGGVGRPSDGGFGLFVMAADGSGDRQPMSDGPYVSDEGSFSPDGRWIAYHSDRSGRHEVYVTRFPGTGEHWQVSPDGGVQARWSADGRALYYLDLTGQLMRVAIPAAGPDQAGRPEPMFDLLVGRPSSTLEQFVVHGDRFLVLRRSAESPPQTIAVLGNWTETLDQGAGTR